MESQIYEKLTSNIEGVSGALCENEREKCPTEKSEGVYDIQVDDMDDDPIDSVSDSSEEGTKADGVTASSTNVVEQLILNPVIEQIDEISNFTSEVTGSCTDATSEIDPESQKKINDAQSHCLLINKLQKFSQKMVIVNPF